MSEELAKFLNQQYFKWAQRKTGRRLATVAEFASWLRVPPTSLNGWMLGAHEPKGENVHKIASKLGPEIYDLLGMPRLMPDDPKFREVAEVWFDLSDEDRNAVMRIIDNHHNGGGSIREHT